MNPRSSCLHFPRTETTGTCHHMWFMPCWDLGGVKGRALCLLVKYTTNGATAPDYDLFLHCHRPKRTCITRFPNPSRSGNRIPKLRCYQDPRIYTVREWVSILPAVTPSCTSGCLGDHREEEREAEDGEKPRAQGFALLWSVHQIAKHLPGRPYGQQGGT